MQYICTMEYYSATKKEWNKAICGSLEIIILSEVSQRNTNIIYHLYVKYKKNDANELIYKTETDSQTPKTYGYQRGEGWIGGLGRAICTTVYGMEESQRDLLYSTMTLLSILW